MPANGIKEMINNASLKTKLLAAFLSVVIVPMVLTAIVTERLTAKKLRQEIESGTEQNLEAAWIQYYVRADQMKYGMLQAAELIETAIIKHDKKFITDKMAHWKNKRPYVDVWAVTDKDGRVISRLNSENSGDIFELNGIVKKAMTTGETVISTEVMPRALLQKEGDKLAEDIAIPVELQNRPGEYNPGYPVENDALMVTVVVPVFDGHSTGNVVGAIITGDILNKDNFVTDTLASKIPDSHTTITKNGVRIATNKVAGEGARAIGVPITAGIMAVLNTGKTYTGEIPWIKEPFIGAYSPIKDNKGKVIGTLSVSVPESKFTVHHRSNRISILLITGLSILFAGGTAFFVTRKITHPIEILADRTRDTAADKMELVPVDVTEDTRDEVSMLSRSFNEMIVELKESTREREVHVSEMEKKSQELSVLNDKLIASNQELEVSLEESQSQAEELQSANEELTILNEELEKKSNELFDANMRITQEEEELKKTRDQLQIIYNGIKDYIVLLSPDCTILEVNKAFLEAYNLPEEKVIGKKCYNFVYGCDQIIPECDLRNGGKSLVPHRNRVTTKNNKTLERYVFPVCDSTGRLLHRVEYIRDVTEETILKEQLIQAEKLSSLGEILSGVAHELNNPLTGVIGYCELLIDSESFGDVALKEKLGKINNAALRCKKIIENLLSFARQHKIEKQYVNINDIVKQTLELKAYQLTVDNIEAVTELDATLPYTTVDPYTIQQVFLNIVNNAHLAMKEKGGKHKLTARTEHNEGTIKIYFSDTGPGISETNLKKIFDPFFTTREVGKGTGLGLSISYGIIKEHNGELRVTSRQGEGATFIIELPILSESEVKKAVTASAADIETAGGEKKNILVVDDEESILELIKAIVESMGHNACVASDAKIAMDKIKNKDYDLIISDIRMPNMDGKELYWTLRRSRPELINKILFTTGDSINSETQKFLQDTKVSYIGKPFSTIELRKLIADYFKQDVRTS
ncbi:MAG: response regulator [Nitrospirae bacterium]|nr:response regulator [Nitrospirota bacterium]